ncbi:MAG: peptidase dimerization [Candidatus Angelobacter sp.]|nr:peptidase dimerization [Candidatus Angelobacter sp.]
MADQRSMRRVGLAFIHQRFQSPCGPVEEEGFDSGSHVILLPQRAQRNTEGQLFCFNSVLLCVLCGKACYPVNEGMDPIALTRRLIDIESISGNEGAVGAEIYEELCRLGYSAHKMPVAHERFNVVATIEDVKPDLVFSTHMDTVPPFISSSEDHDNIYGRGSCDAKGIIVAQIAACQRLRKEGMPVGMLFLVGEERDSLGAKVANENPLGSRFLINGEPTENKIATASKGALRLQLTTTGKMAHSAYPELGESAIDKLLTALDRLRAMKLPVNPEVGECTMNIGLIEGGRATNVIADHARAQLLYRLVGPSDELRRQIELKVKDLAETEFVLEIPFMKLRTVPGIDSMVAKFTTDIPALSNWGTPVLLGPGSIHVAHTERECISKRQLHEAVELYYSVAHQLLKN